MIVKRAWQAGLMIALCMVVVLILQHLGLHSNIYFMGIGAIVTIAQDRDKGLKSGLERLVGCISGGIIGLITIVIYNHINLEWIIPILCFVAVFGLVVFNGNINNQTGTLEALIMFATLLTNIGTANNIYTYTLLRIVDTLIGFILGVIINKILLRNY